MQDDDRLGRGQWLSDFEVDAGALSGKPTKAAEESRKKRSEKRPVGPSSGGLAGLIGALSPMQRFVLALLLFLNVALLGCMCLVMTGRVVPFSP